MKQIIFWTVVIAVIFIVALTDPWFSGNFHWFLLVGGALLLTGVIAYWTGYQAGEMKGHSRGYRRGWDARGE